MRIWKQHPSDNIQSVYNGFTLTELIIVIAIISILATVSIPSFSSYISARKTQITQQKIFSTIRQIRLLAITHAQTIVMCSSVDQITCSANTDSKNWNDGWIVFVDLNENKKRDVKKEDILILEPKNNSHNIKWNRGSYLAYNYEGKVNQNGSFFICDNKRVKNQHSRSIIINRVGRPYLSKFTSTQKLIEC